MKALTCEMCGSTDMIKQDGAFVCQSCGMKYSVEEAKKMMIEGTVEVQGNVQVRNAAQLENLLKLARSSFDSNNYAQAEEFCNQVIAMDDKNYEAWKLKGEAINYQIGSKNQRILEVYNCIMTSYRVLDEEQKTEKRTEILDSLKTCLEGEVEFWLKQFESNRPSESSFNRAKNAYVDAYNKISATFKELGLEEAKKEYLKNFDNFFVKKANSICVSAWKTTVGYNYYRDDFDDYGAHWGKGSAWSGLVTTDTDSYRPMKETCKTFIEEADYLIRMLMYAEEQFNDKTEFKTKDNVYSNIIFFHEKVSNAVYYKIGSNSTDVGWMIDGSLTEESKATRRKHINTYKEKIEEAKRAEGRKVAAESKDESVAQILGKANQNIYSGEFIEAEARYDIVIQKSPDSPLGYVGKALAVGGADKGDERVLAQLRLAAQRETVDEDRISLRFLINTAYGDTKITLLMVAAYHLDYPLVEYLLKSGAKVDMKSSHDTTALWYVCRNKPDEGKADSARRIAKLLLDHGASVNVTNSGGVALYNKETDYQIARMILEKYPNAEPGGAPAKTGGGGCYVATAVYGSYDCPQVWTLRRFRDDTLAATWYGRAFIRTYYAVSPTLVKWFGNTNWFKKMWRGTLDRMVRNLRAKGVEATPYEDRNW